MAMPLVPGMPTTRPRGRIVDLRHQFPHVHVEGSCEPDEIDQGDVSFTALGGANVGPVQTRPEGELLLRQAVGFAQLAQPPPELGLDL
jgi:hypothetical protein